MTIRVCIAGATGWAGSSLAKAIAKEKDLQLVGAVSRTHAGKNLGEILTEAKIDIEVSESVQHALESPCDVFVEYTKPDAAKAHILLAIEKIARCRRNLRIDRRRLQQNRSGSEKKGRGGSGSRQFFHYRRVASEVCTDGGKAYPVLGNHGLCRP